MSHAKNKFVKASNQGGVVRDENINDPDVKELVNELQSEKVKKFVDEKYQGSIITTF